jgi:hypothetical protein
MQVSIRILYPPPQRSTRYDAVKSLRCLSVIFFSLCVALGDKIQHTVILRRNLYWAYCSTSRPLDYALSNWQPIKQRLMFFPGYGPIAIADWSIIVHAIYWSNMGFSVYWCSR